MARYQSRPVRLIDKSDHCSRHWALSFQTQPWIGKKLNVPMSCLFLQVNPLTVLKACVRCYEFQPAFSGSLLPDLGLTHRHPRRQTIHLFKSPIFISSTCHFLSQAKVCISDHDVNAGHVAQGLSLQLVERLSEIPKLRNLTGK